MAGGFYILPIVLIGSANAKLKIAPNNVCKNRVVKWDMEDEFGK